MSKARPLDLSNALRHAFIAGFEAGKMEPQGVRISDECLVAWLNYDPQTALLDRLNAALYGPRDHD
jgi:hypothetical protein